MPKKLERPIAVLGDNPNPQSVLAAWSFNRGKWFEIFATLSEAPVTRAVDKAGNQTAQDITSEMAKTFSAIIQKFDFDEGDEVIKTYLQGKR
ncbi:MAG: hypothetical protein IID39_06120, partial [Planctomycetes bacterium]|nr:hypothetical protein [Planctomycetota bacterium]